MNSQPIISVIIPCYNQAQYLTEALDSVLNQTDNNWECIIVNDGSTDNTETVAKEFTDTDARFKYIYKQNGGLSSARNAGLNASSGLYIQFLDADDFLHEDKFSKSIAVFKHNKQCDLVISNFRHYNQRLSIFTEPYCDINRKINLVSILMDWDIAYTIPIHCAFIKKELLSMMFNEQLKAKEDWLMWINIFLQTDHYYFINEDHAFYRIHPLSATKDAKLMEENTLLAYNQVYNLLHAENLKDIFFERVLYDMQRLNDLKNNKISFLLNSYTYKVGYYLLSPIKKIKSYWH